jgi:hypothetical protein
MAKKQPDRTEFDANRASLRRSVDEVWETTARAHPTQEVAVTFPGLSLLVPGAWNFFEQDLLAVSHVKHVERVETPFGPGWTVTFHPYGSVRKAVA